MTQHHEASVPNMCKPITQPLFMDCGVCLVFEERINPDNLHVSPKEKFGNYTVSLSKGMGFVGDFSNLLRNGGECVTPNKTLGCSQII